MEDYSILTEEAFDDVHKRLLDLIQKKYPSDMKSKVSLINALRKVRTLFSKDETTDQGVELFNIINDILEDKKPISALQSSSRNFSGGSDVHERNVLRDAIHTQINNFNDIDSEKVKENLNPESQVLFDKEYNEIKNILSNIAMTYNEIPLTELVTIRKKLIELISFGIKKKAIEVLKNKTNTWKLGKPDIKYKSELVNQSDMDRLLDLIGQGKTIDQAKEEMKSKKEEPKSEPVEPVTEPIITKQEEPTVPEPEKSDWEKILDDPDIEDEFSLGKDKYADITENIKNKIKNLFLQEDDNSLDFGDVRDYEAQESETTTNRSTESGFDYHGNFIKTLSQSNNKSVKELLDQNTQTIRKSVLQKTLNYLDNEREILRNMRNYVDSLKRRTFISSEINSEYNLKNSNLLEQFGGFLRDIIYFAYRDSWKQKNSPYSMNTLMTKGVDPENMEYVKYVVNSILQTLIRTGPSNIGEYMQKFQDMKQKPIAIAA